MPCETQNKQHKPMRCICAAEEEEDLRRHLASIEIRMAELDMAHRRQLELASGYKERLAHAEKRAALVEKVLSAAREARDAYMREGYKYAGAVVNRALVEPLEKLEAYDESQKE